MSYLAKTQTGIADAIKQAMERVVVNLEDVGDSSFDSQDVGVGMKVKGQFRHWAWMVASKVGWVWRDTKWERKRTLLIV